MCAIDFNVCAIDVNLCAIDVNVCAIDDNVCEVDDNLCKMDDNLLCSPFYGIDYFHTFSCSYKLHLLLKVMESA